MSVNSQPFPDYDLDDMLVVSSSPQLRALSHDLRSTLLELVLERAATVSEMALAVGRPKSTVAYHVDLLVSAGLLKVVRTRQVRAIEERYYGRVARTIYIGALSSEEELANVAAVDGIATAYTESRQAKDTDTLRCTLVHARIPTEHVREFWAEVQELTRRFTQIPRSGEQVYGFVAGLYPTEAPTLPEPAADPRQE